MLSENRPPKINSRIVLLNNQLISAGSDEYAASIVHEFKREIRIKRVLVTSHKDVDGKGYPLRPLAERNVLKISGTNLVNYGTTFGGIENLVGMDLKPNFIHEVDLVCNGFTLNHNAKYETSLVDEYAYMSIYIEYELIY